LGSEWEFFVFVVVDYLLLCLYLFLVELVGGLVRVVDGAGAVGCVAVGAVDCVVDVVVIGGVAGGIVAVVVVDVSLVDLVACEVRVEVEVVA